MIYASALPDPAPVSGSVVRISCPVRHFHCPKTQPDRNFPNRRCWSRPTRPRGLRLDARWPESSPDPETSGYESGALFRRHRAEARQRPCSPDFIFHVASRQIAEDKNAEPVDKRRHPRRGWHEIYGARQHDNVRCLRFSKTAWASSLMEQYLPGICLVRQKLQWMQSRTFRPERWTMSRSMFFAGSPSIARFNNVSILPFLTGLPEMPRII